MNIHSSDIQRELPGNIEAEQALLGAVLVNNEAFDVVSNFLEPKHFHEPLHAKIFEALSDLISQGKVANPVTVKTFIAEETIQEGLTTSQYLARLAAEAVNIVNAPDYAEAIFESHRRRQMISIGGQMVDVGYDLGDTVNLLEEADALQNAFQEILASRAGKEQRTGADIADDYLTAISKVADERKGDGVPLCLPELETVLSDFVLRPGRLYGLLSSSGEGKTSLTLQQIRCALDHGHPVLFLSFRYSFR